MSPDSGTLPKRMRRTTSGERTQGQQKLQCSADMCGLHLRSARDQRRMAVVEHTMPQVTDYLGAAVCLIGAAIILYGARGGPQCKLDGIRSLPALGWYGATRPILDTPIVARV